ncbi:putative DNA repair protein Dds20/Mei5 [Aspergillus saccharolyticus JOP 1030-1]|uniref:Swi5-domain-containing protein n=1 Tax=Aspergillus saccharolyticus JOP 1030-1 TaxID=1450539 RepID=A0A318ZDR9_9EURO|nr:hypothetical protein BP01DRAFT_391435 [Aspergillus saccharolyticus JOP 1030-1]PYH45661.1 hypothetical protein BP01DRAFT_391435 [Aspergillus saccharolyticus JOP 1030-1]
MNNSKRRRLNPTATSSSTLSKPFKSPLRRPVPATDQHGETATHAPDSADSADTGGSDAAIASCLTATETVQVGKQHLALEDPRVTTTPTGFRTNSSVPRPVPVPGPGSQPNNPRFEPPTPNSQAPCPSQTSRRPPRTPRTTRTTTRSIQTNETDNQTILPLTTQKTLLAAEVAALTREYETIQQALRIEAQHKTEELERLIALWRGVSQRAAEEVFLSARERVERMGGLRGITQRRDSWGWDEGDQQGQLSAQSAQSGWEEDCIGDSRDDAGYLATGRGKEEEEEQEDQEFTMDVMLRMMKIDLGVIGYDVEKAGWV